MNKVLLILMTLVLVACGQGPTSETVEVQGAEAATEDVTIKVIFDTPPLWAEEVQMCADKIGVQAEYEPVPFGQLAQKYKTMCFSGVHDADVFHTYELRTAELHQCMLPLNDWLTDEFKSEFMPGVFDAHTTADGNTVGLPFYYWLTSFGFNKTLFDKHGLVPPTNWDELIATAHVLKDEYGVPPVAIPFGSTQGSFLFAQLCRAHGCEILGDDGKPAFNNEGGLKAFEYAKRLLDEGLLDPAGMELTGSFPIVDLLAASGDLNDDSLVKGASMGFVPPPALVNLNNPEMSTVVGDFAVDILPGGPATESAGVHETAAWTIAKSSPNPDKAWEMINCLASEETQRLTAEKIGRVPTRLNLINDPGLRESYPLIPVAEKQLSMHRGGMPVVHKNGTEIAQVISDEMILVVREGKDAQQALNDAEEKINAIIAR